MNKKKTGLMTLIIGMSLSLLAGCGDSSQENKQGNDAENNTQAGLLTTDAGVVLEEVGSFSADDFSILDNQLYQKTENGQILHDYLGRPLGEQYYNVSEYNIYATYQDYYILDGADEKNTPLANLMTAEGEKFFEEDIEGMISRINDTYAAVLYATGTTENKEEVLFYTSGNDMSIIAGPSEGDTWYTGYAKLYNLEKREFIENVTLPNTYMTAIGESVLTFLEDGSIVLFDRDGNMIWDEFDETYYYDGCYFSREAGGQVEICDETMNVLFTLPEGYQLYEYNNYSKNFVVIRNGRDIWLYDRDGTLLFDEPFQNFRSGNDNYCLVQREEDGHDSHLFYYPTKFYSEELYESIDVSEDILDYAFCHLDGVYSMYDGQEKHDLNDIMSTSHLDSFAFTKADESNAVLYHYYVMQDKDFTISGEYSSELTDALLPLEGGEGQDCGLYELVTGKQLFDYVYDDFEVCYGYLYAEKDNTYTVYKIESPFRTE